MSASPNPADIATETAKRPGGLLGKIKLLAFAMLIVTAECLVAYLYIPVGSGSQAAANTSHEAETPEEEGENKKPEEGSEGKHGKENEHTPPSATKHRVERELGQFSVTTFHPTANTTMRIDFRLYGTIDTAEAEEFEVALEQNQHRIRDQVIVTIRSCELVDLTDAGLGLIKRRILEKTNQALGRPFLKGVVFSDFSYIEQ